MLGSKWSMLMKWPQRVIMKSAWCLLIGPWRRHQMKTFSALIALCAGNSPVTSEFPSQRPVTRSFDVFFVLRLNKRLSKKSWVWWFETPSCSLWRHRNASRYCVLAHLQLRLWPSWSLIYYMGPACEGLMMIFLLYLWALSFTNMVSYCIALPYCKDVIQSMLCSHQSALTVMVFKKLFIGTF